jgi:hypothetical protein
MRHAGRRTRWQKVLTWRCSESAWCSVLRRRAWQSPKLGKLPCLPNRDRMSYAACRTGPSVSYCSQWDLRDQLGRLFSALDLIFSSVSACLPVCLSGAGRQAPATGHCACGQRRCGGGVPCGGRGQPGGAGACGAGGSRKAGIGGAQKRRPGRQVPLCYQGAPVFFTRQKFRKDAAFSVHLQQAQEQVRKKCRFLFAPPGRAAASFLSAAVLPPQHGLCAHRALIPARCGLCSLWGWDDAVCPIRHSVQYDWTAFGSPCVHPCSSDGWGAEAFSAQSPSPKPWTPCTPNLKGEARLAP